MNVFTLLSISFAALVLSGCAGKPVVTGKLESAQQDRVVAQQIYDTAKKCWDRSWNIFQDGVIVENRVEITGIVISATRHAPDVGRLRPFVRVTVKQGANGKSQIEIEEVKFEGLSGDDWAKDVRRWVNGDQRCKSSA